MGSTVKSFLDVSSLSAQAMLQGTIIVLKCKFSYSQLLGTGFASFCTGVEHWEHLGPSPRGDGPGPCPGTARGEEGAAAGGRKRGWRWEHRAREPFRAGRDPGAHPGQPPAEAGTLRPLTRGHLQRVGNVCRGAPDTAPGSCSRAPLRPT